MQTYLGNQSANVTAILGHTYNGKYALKQRLAGIHGIGCSVHTFKAG